ncbi:MAG TPA: hypothetical protein VIH57_16810 [Bacteroidales bacterium]
MEKQTLLHLRGKVIEPAVRNARTVNSVLMFLFMAVVLFIAGTSVSRAVPGYSRQTGLACAACHTSFPELNSFGRQFKLNGYTLTSIKTITAPIDSVKNMLNLLTSPPISGMVMSSFTTINKQMPGKQNSNVEFPQQLSLFYSGQVSPHIGAFVQVTYDPQAGTIGMDNTDIRYANHAQLGEKDWTYGFTLNNNPTVQDVWNTVPAWRFPYASSGVAPSPSAATLIEGGLAQQVAGLGTYGLLNNLLYYEISFYRSAPQGAINPPDSTSMNTVKGVAPYWRLALQHQFESQYIMVGAYGMSTRLYPTYTSGPVDHYADIGVDLQYEYVMPKSTFALHTSLIHETRNLAATLGSGGADNGSSMLNSFKIDGDIYFRKGLGLTLGYFSMAGDMDKTLYGTYTGKPDSNGVLTEVSFRPWYNTKFSVQYVMYGKFDGQSSNYDGAGRNGSQNNTLYCLAWISF